MTAQEVLQAALRQHQAGNLAQAEKRYRGVLQADPRNAEALHLLGLLLHQTGHSGDATQLIRRAIGIKPNVAAFHLNLSAACYDLEDYASALEEGRKALDIDPGRVAARLNVGRALLRLDEPAAAAGEFAKAAETAPDLADATVLLAQALKAEGQLDQAEATIQRALHRWPDLVAARLEAADIYKRMERLDEAEENYVRAVELAPKVAEVQSNLGVFLLRRGKPEDAAERFRSALDIDPGLAAVHSNLGTALLEIGDPAAAEECVRTAISLRSDYAEAHLNLALALIRQGRLEDAVASCRRALEIDPELAESFNALAFARKEQGRVEDAIDAYKNTLALQPGNDTALSGLVYTMHYSDRYPAQTVLRESKRWAANRSPPETEIRTGHDNDPDPARKLKVGYVSGDFHRHSVGYFIDAPLACRDSSKTEVTCYSTSLEEDEFTERFRNSADRWRAIGGLSDAALAARIREDAIDILVDLSGHSMGNRLRAFGRRPAPVQVTYLGYPGTTGLPGMDYRITDALADPEGRTEEGYTEQLVRLPHGFLCYTPPMQAPDVAMPPLAERGRVTFASFNNLAKIGRGTLAAWAGILSAVPDARLLLKHRSFACSETRNQFLKAFANHGVGPGRVEFLPYVPDTGAHLEVYNRVDIALDPFPYNGTATTCEALWMGVPVVALAGERHAGRVGVSLLNRIGLGEFVASSPEAYVEIAASLAGDGGRLEDLRAGMRERMRASPLLDGPGFTWSMEEAYRGMWRTWCEAREGQ